MHIYKLGNIFSIISGQVDTFVKNAVESEIFLKNKNS